MSHRLAPEAKAELDSIWHHVAKDSGSLEIADRLIDFLTERFFLLASHPHAGRRRDDHLRPGLRSFPVGKYVIIYRIEDEDVMILHVVPGSRDIEQLLGPQQAQSHLGLNPYGLPRTVSLSHKTIYKEPIVITYSLSVDFYGKTLCLYERASSVPSTHHKQEREGAFTSRPLSSTRPPRNG